MEPTLIIALASGLISYWVVKIWGEIKSPSPVRNCLQYFKQDGDKIILSIIGVVLIILNGPVLPLNGGTITGLVPAFLAGGAIPSMMNNLVKLIPSKN